MAPFNQGDGGTTWLVCNFEDLRRLEVLEEAESSFRRLGPGYPRAVDHVAMPVGSAALMLGFWVVVLLLMPLLIASMGKPAKYPFPWTRHGHRSDARKLGVRAHHD
jgi:hypothetical protein